ncbi:Alpha/beta knot methyltransferase, partial [Sphaerosporella brunnea]
YTITPRRTIEKVNQDAEWIFGASVVEAALKANHRTLYRLYIYAGENRTTASKERDSYLKKLARQRNVEVQEVTDSGMLESMSSSRPHNGYVLEASPLRKIPILSLLAVDIDKSNFGLQKAQHDFTGANQTLAEIPGFLPNRTPGRYPLILMLDELLDPGNLGAILRSAYYMGCSALMVTERNCAPLSPVCLKAAVGAAEFMPILTHVTPPRLIKDSQEKGWKFFAAVPPIADASKDKLKKYLSVQDQEVREALNQGPVVLMLGSEGDGLRTTLSRMCDKYISIPSALDVYPGVDSLNVSVAAAVLVQGFVGGARSLGSKVDNSAAQDTLW